MEYIAASLRLSDYIRAYTDAPRFEQACRACENYAQRWCCPPLAFDFASYCAPYTYIRLIGARIPEPGGDALLIAPRRAFADYLIAQENESTRAFIAGSCTLCRRCARADGAPCVHPEQLRYSLEAFGLKSLFAQSKSGPFQTRLNICQKAKPAEEYTT